MKENKYYYFQLGLKTNINIVTILEETQKNKTIKNLYKIYKHIRTF